MKSFEVACPKCKKKFLYHSSEFRPFCSEKCKMVDLGHWLSESYAVPATKLTEEEMQQLEQITNEKEKDNQDDSDN